MPPTSVGVDDSVGLEVKPMAVHAVGYLKFSNHHLLFQEVLNGVVEAVWLSRSNPVMCYIPSESADNESGNHRLGSQGT